jgi:flagellar hook-associated protein FlgK
VSLLSIGNTALLASQTALAVVGQNLANTNTPGYSREVPIFTPLTTVGAVGDGVSISNVQRQRDNLLAAAFTASSSQTATLSTQVPLLQQMQNLVNTGPNSLDGLLGSFFNGVEQLTADPSNVAQRQSVLTSLSNVTNSFNQSADGLHLLQVGAVNQVATVVSQLNSYTSQIASLNGQIQSLVAAGNNANTLEDQRDQLVNQVAQLVNVRTVNQPEGVVNVLGTGAALVVGNMAQSFQAGTDANNNVVINATGGSAATLTPSGGQLAGLMQIVNQAVPSFQGQLNTLAQAFAQGVDTIQATGLGSGGPQTATSGTRPAASATLPLAGAGTQLPVQAGTLTVGITDQTTGQRTLVQVAVNPATQSLQQFAAALTAATGGQLQASVNPSDNTLQLQAQSGFAFDFAGQTSSSPTFNGFAGTTVPQLAGIYTGPNTSYTFQVVGSGTVGQTAGLALQVTDANNTPVATVNIGQGYAAGSPLSLPGGVTLQLSAGTLTVGSFTYPVVSQPDTSGVLAALGVNSLLTGSTAGDLGVNPTVLGAPTQLAGSLTGQPSDGSNLVNLAALQDQLTLANGTQTYLGYYTNMVAEIGTQVQNTQQLQTSQQSLTQQLDTQQQAVSGVDPNTEMINMLQYQQSFQMSAKYIDTVNTTFADLLNLIGPGPA